MFRGSIAPSLRTRRAVPSAAELLDLMDPGLWRRNDADPVPSGPVEVALHAGCGAVAAEMPHIRRVDYMPGGEAVIRLPGYGADVAPRTVELFPVVQAAVDRYIAAAAYRPGSEFLFVRPVFTGADLMRRRFVGLGRRIGLDGAALKERLREVFLACLRDTSDAAAIAVLSGQGPIAIRTRGPARPLREVHPLGLLPASALESHRGPVARNAISPRRIKKLSRRVLDALAEARRTAAAYPKEVRDAVGGAVEAGLSHRTAASLYGVSQRFAQEVIAERRGLRPAPAGRTRTLSDHDDALFLHAMANPSLSYTELVKWLETRGVRVSIQSVADSLTRSGAPPRGARPAVGPIRLAGHLDAIREMMTAESDTSIPELLAWLQEVHSIETRYQTVGAALRHLGIRPGRARRPKRSKLTRHAEKLRMFRRNWPDRTIEELRQWLRDEHGIGASWGLLGNELRKLGINPGKRRRPRPATPAPASTEQPCPPPAPEPAAAGHRLGPADERALSDRIRERPSESWDERRRWLRENRGVAIGRSAFANALARIRAAP